MGGIETNIARICGVLHSELNIYILNISSKSHISIENAIGEYAEIINYRDVSIMPQAFVSKYSAVNHCLPVSEAKLKRKIDHLDYVIAVDSETNIMGMDVAIKYNSKFLTSSFHALEYVWENGFYFRVVQKDIVRKISRSNIYFMNEVVKKTTIESLNIEDNNENIIPIAVDLTRYRNCKPNFTSNRISSVGRLVDFKPWHELVIRNIDKINDVTKRTYEYHIYGDGPLRSTLEELAKQQRSTIRFHGTADYGELPEIFDNSFIFIGGATAIIEAAAAGLPSIIGTGDYYNNKCYGFLIDYDNFLSGEEFEGGKYYSFVELVAYIDGLSREKYFEFSARNIHHSNRFDLSRNASRLLEFARRAERIDRGVEYSKLRYFISNMTWLIFNRLGILKDRAKRYTLVW